MLVIPDIDWSSITPILLLSLTAMAVLLLDTSRSALLSALVLPVSWTGLAGSAGWAVRRFTSGGFGFENALYRGPFPAALIALYALAAGLTVLLCSPSRFRGRLTLGEIASLVLFSTAGMVTMAQSGDLLMLFLGLELMSIPIYALVGLRKGQKRANEAALKYFLLGAFSSALMLYGIALVFGTAGTIVLGELSSFIVSHGAMSYPLFDTALLMVAIGFLFKASLIPFHLWAPDAYQGAPAPIAGFMSTTVKAAALVALAVFLTPLPNYGRFALGLVTALTVIAGNLLALRQTNLKRMLAYSSIAHAGYLMIPFFGNMGYPDGLTAMIFYLFVYTFLNLGAFALVGWLAEGDADGSDAPIASLRGLHRRDPFSALCLAVFMLGLAGIPPLAGFIGKLSLFTAGMSVFSWPLVALAAVGSAIGAGYYLRVVVTLYMEEEPEPADGRRAVEPMPAGFRAAALVCLAATVALGLVPSVLLEPLKKAVESYLFQR